MPAAAIQRSNARTGHNSVAIGRGYCHCVSLAALRLRKPETQPALGVLEILHPDVQQLGAAERAGKPHQ